MRTERKVSSPATGFAWGAGCLASGYRLVMRPGLRRFVVVPLLVNTLLFSVLTVWIGSRFDRLLERLLPAWLGWLEWLIWPLFALGVLLVAFYGFTLLAALIAGPFNGLLAARVERHLTGRAAENGGGLGATLLEIPAALLGELRKWVYFLGWLLLLILAALIPGLNLFWPLLWALFGAWTLALEFLDFPLGNRGLDFPGQRGWLRRHRAACLGFGAAVMAAALVPVLNFALMPAAVAGATRLVIERENGAPGQLARQQSP